MHQYYVVPVVYILQEYLFACLRGSLGACSFSRQILLCLGEKKMIDRWNLLLLPTQHRHPHDFLKDLNNRERIPTFEVYCEYIRFFLLLTVRLTSNQNPEMGASIHTNSSSAGPKGNPAKKKGRERIALRSSAPGSMCRSRGRHYFLPIYHRYNISTEQ